MARKRAKQQECPNCGLPLAKEDNFCARCGQENHTHKLPVRHFLVELLSGLFNFDTKLFRTLRDLFWPPGMVIREFNANKRGRYVHPLRLYLFTSLVFFLLLGWSTARIAQGPSPTVAISGTHEKVDDGLVLNFGEGEELVDSTLQALAAMTPLTDAAIDSTLASNGIDTGFWPRVVVRMAMNLSVSANANRKAAYVNNILGAFSKLMFVLLPLFALLLYGLHIRSRMFFTEHLIFALYFHSVVFLLFAVRLMAGQLFDGLTDLRVPMLVAVAYLFWAIRTVYHASWGVTLLRTIALVWLYALLLVVGTAAAAVIGAL